MARADINENARILPVGEHVRIVAGTTIPERCLRPHVIICVPQAQAQIFRILSVTQPPSASGWQRDDIIQEEATILLSSLTQTGRRSFLRKELEAIRPLGFIVLDRAWDRLSRFKEGGIYQAWPTGQLLRVRNRHLVDAYTERRINPDVEPRKLPPVILWAIPRWEPTTPEAVAAEGE